MLNSESACPAGPPVGVNNATPKFSDLSAEEKKIWKEYVDELCEKYDFGAWLRETDSQVLEIQRDHFSSFYSFYSQLANNLYIFLTSADGLLCILPATPKGFSMQIAAVYCTSLLLNIETSPVRDSLTLLLVKWMRKCTSCPQSNDNPSVGTLDSSLPPDAKELNDLDRLIKDPEPTTPNKRDWWSERSNLPVFDPRAAGCRLRSFSSEQALTLAKETVPIGHQDGLGITRADPFEHCDMLKYNLLPRPAPIAPIDLQPMDAI
jgi:hypothetical protein